MEFSRTKYTIERAMNYYSNGEEITVAISHAQHEYDDIILNGFDYLKNMTEQEFIKWLKND